MSEYKRHVVKSTIFVSALTLFGVLIGYVLRMINARYLPPDEYGLFYAVMSFVALFSVVKNFEMQSAVAKFIPEFISKRAFGKVKGSLIIMFISSLIMSGILTLGIILLAPYLAEHFFRSDNATLVLIIIALSYWLASILDFFAASLRGAQEMIYLSLTDVIRTIATLISIIILYQVTKTIMAPALAYLFSLAPSILIAYFMFRKTFNKYLAERSEASIKLFKQLFMFGVPVMIGTLGFVLISYTDTLTLTYFRSLTEVGLYNAALPLALVLCSLGNIMSAIILPLASELWTKNNRQGLREGLFLVYKYTMMVLMPGVLILVAFPDYALSVLFSDVYVPALNALRVLAFGTVLYTISQVNIAVLIGIGRPGLNSRIIIVGAALNIVLNLTLARPFGIVGAGLATGLTYAFISVMTTHYLKGITGFTLPKLDWLKIMLASLPFFLVLYLFRSLSINPILEVLAALLLASVLYLGVLYFTKAITDQSFAEMRKVFRRQ